MIPLANIYVKKVPTFQCRRFTIPDDYNLMLLDWGEKFHSEAVLSSSKDAIKIYSMNGLVTARFGDWVMFDGSGFGCLTDDQFNASYELKGL